MPLHQAQDHLVPGPEGEGLPSVHRSTLRPGPSPGQGVPERADVLGASSRWSGSGSSEQVQRSYFPPSFAVFDAAF